MISKTVLSAALLTLLSAMQLWSQTIVSNGIPKAAIYLDAKATPGEKAGASELVEYFRKISGAEVGKSDHLNDSGIVLGTVDSEFAPLEIKKSLDGRKSESFAFKTIDGKLYIIGKTQAGTYFGTVTLLQDYLNVRWFYPGENGEYVEKSPDIIFPELDRVEEPAFLWRELSQTGAGGPAMASHIWAFRNKLQAPPCFSHVPRFQPQYREFFDARMADYIQTEGGHLTYYNVAPPKKYLDSHPEFFALVNGKRSQETTHATTHHCLSNPELQEMVANYICGLHQKYGKQITYLFGGPDSVKGWCECDNCRALDTDGVFDVSHRFHVVAQSIAKLVYAKCPDAQLETWAYANYRSIPKDVAIDSRMNVYFCSHGRCFAHALDDPSCARNAEILDLLKKWQELNPKIHLYEYAHCTPMHWTPIEKTLAHDLKLFKDMGILGWKEEISFPDAIWNSDNKNPSLEDNPDHGSNKLGSEWLYWNVASRLTWNPDLDLETVIQDLESKYYGVAYPAMKKFNDIRRQTWDNCRGCFGYPTGDSRTPMLLQKDGLREQLFKLLDEADALAEGQPTIQERLHRDRIYFKHYWVKANDIFRQRESNNFTAPTATSPVVIDGDENDPAWAGACYISDFKLLNVYKPEEGAGKPFPTELETTVGCLSDDDNFYFLVQAKEPNTASLKATAPKDGPLWDDDSIEFFLDPMNDANAYYQVIVNTKGAVFDARQPGNQSKVDFGVTAAVKVHNDRYVMEVKIPIAEMEGVFKPGLNWRIQIARNRYVEDGGMKGCATLDAELPHLRSSYRTIVIGNPLLKNGDFSKIDPKTQKPQGWIFQNNCQIKKITDRKNNVLLSSGGTFYNLIWDWKGPLGQSPKPRPIRILVRAKGNGVLRLSVARYHDNWDGGKLDRKNFPTVPLGKFTVTDDFKPYETTYTIEPDQWIGLFLHAENGNLEIESAAIMFQ